MSLRRLQEVLSSAKELEGVKVKTLGATGKPYQLNLSVSVDGVGFEFEAASGASHTRWNYHFSRAGLPSKEAFGLGKGDVNPFKVGSIAVAFLVKVLKEAAPWELEFSADKADKGRVEVYQKVLGRMNFERWGYSLREVDGEERVVFILRKVKG